MRELTRETGFGTMVADGNAMENGMKRVFAIGAHPDDIEFGMAELLSAIVAPTRLM